MGGEGGERRDGRKEREENGEEDEDVYGPSISRYSMRLFFTAGARFKFNHPTFFFNLFHEGQIQLTSNEGWDSIEIWPNDDI